MPARETEKHHQIMTAAAALFARQGYRKTTVDEIVAAAGISKGLFYHYFENKKTLYIALYNAYVDIFSRCLREQVNTAEPDFFERLRQLTRLRIDFITAYPSLWDFLYAAYYEEHPDVLPAIKAKNEALLQNSHAGSAAGIDWSRLKKGLSPDRAIELITWVADGFVRKAAAAPETDKTVLYAQFEEYFDYLKSGMYTCGEDM